MSRAPTVYLDTLGCEKNLVDSESAMGLLLRQGFTPVADAEGADLIVVNTCGFLASARAESLDRIEELAEVKGQGKLVVMGCFVQGATHDIQSLVPEVDHVLGVGRYDELAGLIESGAAAPALAPPDEAPYAGYGVRALSGPSHVAHLKIAEGCDQSCTFCKIPLLRGSQRSRPIGDLVSEAERLCANGVSELILIAQNSSAYGNELPGRPGLARLCEALAGIGGLRWIRIMYAFPPMFSRRLIDEVYAVDKVASYLDIPIQHASPPVLKAMNRGYDPERLRRQMEHLRGVREGIMLRSTALLGFPGETEDDVVALLDFLAEVQFDHLGTFVYSHEEQTASFDLVDDVDPAEKEDRRCRVEELQWDLALERKSHLLGTTLEVVVDECHDEGPPEEFEDLALERGEDPRGAWKGQSVAFGRSAGFCYEIDGGLWFPGAGLAPGDTLSVRVSGCGPFDLVAEREHTGSGS